MPEHAIPQDILSYEFKLFAGLTWKQFVYVGIGVATGVLLIQGSIKGIVPALIGYPFGLLAITVPLSLALVKYQGRPMEDWILDAIRISNTPLLRAWMKNKKSLSLKKALSSKPKVFPSYVLALLELDDNTPNSKTTIKEGYLEKITQSTKSNIIFLNPDNAEDYKVANIQLPNIPNTIAFLLITPNQEPLTNVTATLKDSTGNIIKALKSNQQGIIYFNQTIPNGVYVISFSHPQYTFPEIQVEMTGSTYPLIKITSIE